MEPSPLANLISTIEKREFERYESTTRRQQQTQQKSVNFLNSRANNIKAEKRWPQCGGKSGYKVCSLNK